MPVKLSFIVVVSFVFLIHLQTHKTSFCFAAESVFETLNTNSIEALESLLDFPILDNKSPIISQNCSTAFRQFSRSLVNFTSCSIQHARPVHLCMQCAEVHSAAVNSFQNLKKQDAECQAYFFGSDQLGIVDIMYSTVSNLWTKSSCQNCYSHYNETETFFQASQDYLLCIQSLNKTVDISNSTCDKCHLVYANLSQSFHKFTQWQKELDETICMDIIDTMNISRRLWQDYDCIVVFGTDIGFPNVLTALTVGATPVMFYLLAKNISRLEDVKIVRQKRKFMTVTPPSTENNSTE